MKSNEYNFKELIVKAKQLRSAEYSRISHKQYDKLSYATEQSIQTITNNTKEITNINQCIRIANLIFVVIKLQEGKTKELIEVLHRLNPKNEQVGIFISYVYSKLLKHTKRKNALDNIDFFKNDQKSKNNQLQNPYFLFFLAKHSWNSVLLYNTKFVNAVMKMITSEKISVRNIAFKTLNLYLQILEKAQTDYTKNSINFLFKFAQNNLFGSPSEKHGAFLIFSSLFEHFSSFFESQALDLMNFFREIYPTCSSNISSLIIYNIVLLANIKPDIFCHEYFTNIFKILVNDNLQHNVDSLNTLSLLKLIQLFPFLIRDYSNEFLNIIYNLLVTAYESPLENGFRILDFISKKAQDLIVPNNDKYAEILIKTRITKDYIQVVPSLLKMVSNLWNYYRPLFIESLPENLEKPELLEFISLCPKIDSPILIKRLLELLTIKDPVIRSYASRTLLLQFEYENNEISNDILMKIVTIAISDPVPKVREMILRSFPQQSYKFLTSDPILTSITSLIKDENLDVCIAAIELLGKISEISPFNVLPSLRKLLLDIIFLIDTRTSYLAVKDEMTRLLKPLVTSAFEILPIYAKNLCDVSLRRISFIPIRRLTYFEQSYIKKINLNIIKAIGSIAERDVNLISSHLTQFADFFMYMLQQHGSKQLKIAIVSTLYSIMANTDNTSGIDIKKMFSILLSLQNKWNSKRLFVAILRLLGLIGAIDQVPELTNDFSDDIEEIKYDNPSYFVSCAYKSLISILLDESLITHHQSAFNALVEIFCTDKTALISYFNEFMNTFLNKIKKQKIPEYIDLLKKICQEVPQEWITSYSEELFSLIKDLWRNETLYSKFLELLQVLAKKLNNRFSSFAAEFITSLLDDFRINQFNEPELCRKILISFISFMYSASDYLFLIYPELIKTVSSPDTHILVRYYTLKTLRIYVQHVDFTSFLSTLIRQILNIIQYFRNETIQELTLQILYSLIVRMKSSFLLYSDITFSVLKENQLFNNNFTKILESKSTDFSDFPFIDTSEYLDESPKINDEKNQKMHVINVEKICKSFCFNEDDETPWNRKEWFQNLTHTLLEQSTSPSIRACSFLCDSLFHFADKLFNPAFLSIWPNISESVQTTISGYISGTLLSEVLPSSIRSFLINFIEFMERTGNKIQISKQVLCKSCEKSQQHANAFYFATKWYEEEPNNIEPIKLLIKLSNYMGMKKTFIGISCNSQKNNRLGRLNQMETLGQWSEALDYYKKQHFPSKFTRNILISLKRLQRWDEIIEMIPSIDSSLMKDVAPIIASALFHRQEWDKLPQVLQYCKENSIKVLIISALYQIKHGSKEMALNYVGNAYNAIVQNARGVFKHDKTGLYSLLVQAQQLYEITEIAQEKINKDIWERRLLNCRKSYKFYHQILSVRLTVFTVEDLMPDILKMIKLALISKDFQLFDSSIHFFFPDKTKYNIEIAFLQAKGNWARGKHKEALEDICNIIKTYKTDNNYLKSKIFYTYGTWIISLSKPENILDTISVAIKYFKSSIDVSKEKIYYKALKSWAWASSVLFNSNKSNIGYAKNAINGFLQCIYTKSENSLSQVFQMISLFSYSNLDELSFSKYGERIQNLNDSVLLNIIPQLFSMLKQNESHKSSFASKIIIKLLPKHYHVLIYPLLFSIRTTNCTLAHEILSYFQEENQEAVYESKLITNGMLLCSSTTLEKWYNSLIEIISLLQNKQLAAANQQLLSILSIKSRKDDSNLTNETRMNLQNILISSKENNLLTTIKNLHIVYSKIKNYINGITSISLNSVSPELSNLSNSVLAVPGTYSISSPIINIVKFDSKLEIFNSKQRPRLCRVLGSDGIFHLSLIKGCQNLQLDQYFMQFFQLINQLIQKSYSKENREMKIYTYSIIPLSLDAGMIQFLDGTDTIYSLIREYRTKKNIPIFQEDIIISKQFINNIDLLRPIQRYESLKMAIKETKDTDLREIIWLTSSNSRDWISRNLAFIHSSALMSIIGYILGLGDRHPSNIMIHRKTGNSIHIDFSDCFEINSKKIKFPEYIPFRLTRTMVKSFVPNGVEGDFRITCEETLKIVKENKESIIAVLDIFLNPIAEVDVNHSSISIEGAIQTITKKINGYFSDSKSPITIDKHVSFLIDQATDLYALSHLYHGWMPLW